MRVIVYVRRMVMGNIVLVKSLTLITPRGVTYLYLSCGINI